MNPRERKHWVAQATPREFPLVLTTIRADNTPGRMHIVDRKVKVGIYMEPVTKCGLILNGNNRMTVVAEVDTIALCPKCGASPRAFLDAHQAWADALLEAKRLRQREEEEREAQRKVQLAAEIAAIDKFVGSSRRGRIVNRDNSGQVEVESDGDYFVIRVGRLS